MEIIIKFRNRYVRVQLLYFIDEETEAQRLRELAASSRSHKKILNMWGRNKVSCFSD